MNTALSFKIKKEFLSKVTVHYEKKKLWIVSELYYPSSTSTGHILTKISEGLTKEYQIEVITGPPSYWSETKNYKNKETMGSISIHRVKIPYLDKNVTLQRLLRLLMLTVKLAHLSIKKIEQNSTLLVVTTPISYILFLPILKLLKKNISIYILVHDVYPNNLAVVGLLKASSPIYKFLDAVFTSVFKRANRLIVLGRDMEEILLEKGLKKTSIIENWAESDIIDLEPIDYCNKANKQEKITFLFTGNIGKLQGIEFFLEAIRKIKTKRASFIFAGNGALSPSVEQFAKENPEMDIQIIGTFERDEQEGLIRMCDVGLVTLSPGMFGLGVPSKAYNYFAGGKPILYVGDKNSEIDKVVNESNVGWSVGASDPELVAKVIDDICSVNMVLMTEYGRNAKELALDTYTLENTHQKYLSVFENGKHFD